MTVDLEVRNLVGAYCNEVTTGDADRWSQTWAVDAVWGIPGGGTINGRSAIREQFTAIRRTYLLCVQAVLSATVEPDGPDASPQRSAWGRVSPPPRRARISPAALLLQ